MSNVVLWLPLLADFVSGELMTLNRHPIKPRTTQYDSLLVDDTVVFIADPHPTEDYCEDKHNSSLFSAAFTNIK